MKTTGLTHSFTSPINVEHTSGAVHVLAKQAQSTLELFTPSGLLDLTLHEGWGQIEWCYLVGTSAEDCEHINLHWSGGELTDYDGVFALPLPLISWLRTIGLRIDAESFEFD